jgi:hypothetical protein
MYGMKMKIKTFISVIYCRLRLDVNETPQLTVGGSIGYSTKMSCKTY